MLSMHMPGKQECRLRNEPLDRRVQLMQLLGKDDQVAISVVVEPYPLSVRCSGQFRNFGRCRLAAVGQAEGTP
jgi:hypothetical protein